ncbi:MAG: CBS and ACT domain-containing protein [Syntrophobacteraceae bacterium]|nr:CBS and ACT domain-containing protein [Syntrophobacteraceae bacterium]
MIVRHWMSTDLVTIGKDASIQEAMALMKRESIRHLPVVDQRMNLLGWITDADLRGVLIASMIEELTLEDVMIRKPLTVQPEMPLEEAARFLLDKRIGGLPIVENGVLTGIITVADILSAFITFLGLFTQSTRLDIKVSGSPNPLPEITRIVRTHGAEIISLCQVPSSEESAEFSYSLRLKRTDPKPIIADLEQNGIEVVASLDM